MESTSAVQENISNSPYIVYGMFCGENEVIPKLTLDSKMQINVQAKSSQYSDSLTLFSVTREANSETVTSEQAFKQTQKLPSEPSDSVNEYLEKEILIQNNIDEVSLKSNLNLTVKCDENGVSDLDSSVGVGKASSGYCTDTSEKEEFGTDENIAQKVAKPLCSENSVPPTSSSAADEVQAGETSANLSHVDSSSKNKVTRSYSLRPRSKRSSTVVPPDPPPDPQEDLLPYDMEKLLHRDYKPMNSEEIYLKKLIQQLDTTYTKAVVLVTRLENMDPSLWRKYLSK